jgi:hypothetical protein
VLEWLDTHSGSVVAIATFVLLAVTAYYAWTSRARQPHVRAGLPAFRRRTHAHRQS